MNGAIGCWRWWSRLSLMTTKKPRPTPTASAASDHTMRQRSSSRWSRNGVSPVAFLAIVSRLRAKLSDLAESIPRQLGFGTRRELPHHALQRRTGSGGLPLTQLRESVLVQRRRSVLGARILRHHESVRRIRLGGPALFRVRLRDVQLRGRRFLEVGIAAQQLLEPPARRSVAA